MVMWWVGRGRVGGSVSTRVQVASSGDDSHHLDGDGCGRLGGRSYFWNTPPPPPPPPQLPCLYRCAHQGVTAPITLRWWSCAKDILNNKDVTVGNYSSSQQC
jgi:hypothetical protein